MEGEKNVLQDLKVEQGHQGHTLQVQGQNLVLKVGQGMIDTAQRLIMEKQVLRPHILLKIGHTIIMNHTGHIQIVIIKKVGHIHNIPSHMTCIHGHILKIIGQSIPFMKVLGHLVLTIDNLDHRHLDMEKVDHIMKVGHIKEGLLHIPLK